MNIKPFMKPKSHVLLTTLFFAGIIISGGALYVLRFNLSADGLNQAYTIVSVTFFAGITSLILLARSKRQSVVYLRKEHESVASVGQEIESAKSRLDLSTLETIVAADKQAPQRAITELCDQLQAGQGAVYVVNEHSLELKYGYALSPERNSTYSLGFGEGLVGRVASEGSTLYIDKLPEGYITVFSGLGAASPSHLVIIPVKKDNEVRGVIEIATFSSLNSNTLRDLEIAAESLAAVI